MKKTLLSACVLLIAATCAQAATKIGDLYYTLDAATNTAAVAKAEGSDTYTGDITIPATVSYDGTDYSVTTIADSAFYKCAGLISITIPSNVTSIGKYAFYGCEGLTGITISESVTSIGDNTFYGCTGLTSILIPASVTSIGEGAFGGCPNVTSIVVDENNIIYESPDNCNAIIEKSSNTLVCGCQNTTIPNTITAIGICAFDGCKKLTSIAIPEGVTTIGKWAFYECEGLSSISIPSSVTTIDKSAFYGCTGLTSITIPEGVTTIGVWAFGNCTNLESITLPNSLTSIGGSAFKGCTGLTSITIPEGVTTIEIWTFSYCTNLESITLPSSLTSIGGSAFQGCTGLTSITIPEGVTTIGLWAFSYCTNLESITLPNSLTSIGNDAFHECVRITDIAIPDGVTDIGLDAFYHVLNVTYHGTAIDTKNVTWGCRCINGYVEGIFAYSNNTKTVLWGCLRTATGAIDIPNTVKTIGRYVFSDCKEITSVTIPNSVTTIGNYAFNGCDRLDTIIIPSTVTSIDNSAIGGSNDLKVFVYITSPIAIDSEAFRQLEGTNSTVYIPCGTLATYQKLTGWSSIDNFQEMLYYTLDVQSQDAAKGTVEIKQQPDCETEAVIEATPNAGYKFVQWSDGNTDNPRTLAVTEDLTLTAQFDVEQSTPTAMQNTEIPEIYAENGRIYGAEGMQIFTIVGQNVTEMNGQLSGVYVVKVGNVAQKVIVR
jgi:hypothetical protein